LDGHSVEELSPNDYICLRPRNDDVQCHIVEISPIAIDHTSCLLFKIVAFQVCDGPPPLVPEIYDGRVVRVLLPEKCSKGIVLKLYNAIAIATILNVHIVLDIRGRSGASCEISYE
jgi:hypothetical protein